MMNERTLAIAARLETAAREMGMIVTLDGRVSEEDAAILMNAAQSTLQKWRQQGYKKIPTYSLNTIGRKKVSYYIYDIAQYLASNIKSDEP